jgi:hypothetical protein
MIRRTLVLLPALVLVAGIAACGDGGDDSAEERSGDDTAEGGKDETDPTSSTLVRSPDDAAAPGEEPPAGEDAPGDLGAQLGIDRTFTGEGSETFCAEVTAMEESGQADPAKTDDATAAARMAAITPPAEIEAEWTNLHETLAAGAEDEDGFASMSQEEMDAWGMAGAVVAAYLGDVCGLDPAG